MYGTSSTGCAQRRLAVLGRDGRSLFCPVVGGPSGSLRAQLRSAADAYDGRWAGDVASALILGEATMCADGDCDGQEPPPIGEQWCMRRLDIELERFLSGYLMCCGTPALVRLEPAG